MPHHRRTDSFSSSSCESRGCAHLAAGARERNDHRCGRRLEATRQQRARAHPVAQVRLPHASKTSSAGVHGDRVDASALHTLVGLAIRAERGMAQGGGGGGLAYESRLAVRAAGADGIGRRGLGLRRRPAASAAACRGRRRRRPFARPASRADAKLLAANFAPRDRAERSRVAAAVVGARWPAQRAISQRLRRYSRCTAWCRS